MCTFHLYSSAFAGQFQNPKSALNLESAPEQILFGCTFDLKSCVETFKNKQITSPLNTHITVTTFLIHVDYTVYVLNVEGTYQTSTQRHCCSTVIVLNSHIADGCTDLLPLYHISYRLWPKKELPVSPRTEILM